MSFSFWEILLLAAIALLVFGGGRLPKLGRDLADAVNGFRAGMRRPEEAPADPEPEPREPGTAARPPAAGPAAPIFTPASGSGGAPTVAEVLPPAAGQPPAGPAVRGAAEDRRA